MSVVQFCLISCSCSVVRRDWIVNHNANDSGNDMKPLKDVIFILFILWHWFSVLKTLLYNDVKQLCHLKFSLASRNKQEVLRHIAFYIYIKTYNCMIVLISEFNCFATTPIIKTINVLFFVSHLIFCIFLRWSEVAWLWHSYHFESTQAENNRIIAKKIVPLWVTDNTYM